MPCYLIAHKHFKWHIKIEIYIFDLGMLSMTMRIDLLVFVNFLQQQTMTGQSYTVFCIAGPIQAGGIRDGPPLCEGSTQPGKCHRGVE